MPCQIRGLDQSISKGPLICEVLKQSIEREYHPDYRLIDARTGITEMGGAATTLFPDSLVALLAPNQESLDGTRTMLWSIKRTRRLQGRRELSIIPVLARIPFFGADDEEALVKRTHKFLTEVPADPKDHLANLAPPLVLHAERELERKEHLVLPDPDPISDLRLRVDYLRLIGQIAAREEIDGQLSSMVEDLKQRAWQEPSEAEEDFRYFVRRFPYPAAFRAQVQLLQIGRRDPVEQLKAAYKYWQWSGSFEDPFQQSIVENCFTTESFLKDPDEVMIEFVAKVWSAVQPPSVAIGLTLAEVYKAQGKLDLVSSTLSRLPALERFEMDPIIRWIRLDAHVHRFSHAFVILDKYSDELGQTLTGFIALLETTVMAADSERCVALVRGDPFRRHHPALMADLVGYGDTLRQVYKLAGATTEWQDLLRLRLAESRSDKDLYRLDPLFKVSGLGEALKSKLGELEDLEAMRELNRK